MKTVGESLPNFSTVFVLDSSIKERRMVNDDTIHGRFALELGVKHLANGFDPGKFTKI